MQIGSGAPQVATVLGTTTPTQTAFTGTASALDDLLPALPQAVGAMGGWFKGIGSFNNLTGSGNIPGFATQAGGFIMGLDRVLAQNLTGGIALGYLHTNVSEDTGSTGTIDTPRLSIYGSYALGNIAIDATAGYGYDFYSANRPFPLLGQTASSSYNGQEATAALQASAKLNAGGFTLLPAIGMVYAHASQNSASESGAPGFDLNVNSNSANSLRPFAAVTVAKNFTTGNGTVLTPEADISYSYETLGTTPPSTVSVGGGTFVISGLLPQRNNLTIGGGVTAQLTDVLALEAAYHITPPTGNNLAQTVSLALDYRF
jgi:outer membrane autotransporter protein